VEAVSTNLKKNPLKILWRYIVTTKYQKDSTHKFCGGSSHQNPKRIRPKITMGPVIIEKKF
jgi:hypothetical protein